MTGSLVVPRRWWGMDVRDGDLVRCGWVVRVQCKASSHDDEQQQHIDGARALALQTTCRSREQTCPAQRVFRRPAQRLRSSVFWISSTDGITIFFALCRRAHVHSPVRQRTLRCAHCPTVKVAVQLGLLASAVQAALHMPASFFSLLLRLSRIEYSKYTTMKAPIIRAVCLNRSSVGQSTAKTRTRLTSPTPCSAYSAPDLLE